MQLVATLNSGTIASTTEVVVSPPSVYLHAVSSKLRKDFAVASQVSAAAVWSHNEWYMAYK